MQVWDTLQYLRVNPASYSELNSSGVGGFMYDNWNEQEGLKLSGEDIDDEIQMATEEILWNVGYL